MKKLLLSLGFLALGGCGAAMGFGGWSKEKSAANFQQHYIGQAEFDLGCTADKIKIVGISSQPDTAVGSVIGATGCGKKTTYICNNAGTWMKNSETSAAP